MRQYYRCIHKNPLLMNVNCVCMMCVSSSQNMQELEVHIKWLNCKQTAPQSHVNLRGFKRNLSKLISDIMKRYITAIICSKEHPFTVNLFPSLIWLNQYHLVNYRQSQQHKAEDISHKQKGIGEFILNLRKQQMVNQRMVWDQGNVVIHQFTKVAGMITVSGHEIM